MRIGWRSAATRGPLQHSFGELDVERFAQQAQQAPRVFEHVTRIQNRRSAAGLFANEMEELDLLGQAGVFEHGLRVFAE